METVKREYKYCKVDPLTCSIDDLKKEIDRLTDLSDFLECKQLSEKLFLNSCYGAIASPWFFAHNTEVARSITLQGQDLNHFSENAVNDYFCGIFQNDTELHKKLGIDHELAKSFDISKGRITDNGPIPDKLLKNELSHLKGNYTLTVAGDTDSVRGDTVISLDNQQVPIEDAYTQLKEENFDSGIELLNSQQIIPNKFRHQVKTYDPEKKQVVFRPIKYIMRHKVSKAQFRIKTKSGREVFITGDHSVMVLRNGKLISVTAKEINPKTDKLISLK